MAINTIINWEWLLETGRIQEAAADEDYIIVGSFDSGRKTSSTASRSREYMIKVSDFLANTGGGGETELEIQISMSSDDILGANPIGAGQFELIPTPGKGFYIDLESIRFEYTFKDLVYSMVSTGWLIQYSNGAIGYVVDKSICTNGSDGIRVVRHPFSNDTLIPENTGVSIISSDLIGFTDGNGTLLLKATYFIRKIG